MERFSQFIDFRAPQSGQILLIMVLALVVVLTVGLSVASRSITNVKISKQNEESARAFQAAEAGVQRALQEYNGTDVDIGSATNQQNLQNNAFFNSELNVVDGTHFLVRGGSPVEQSVGADVQLSSSSSFNGNITVFFSSTDQTNCTSNTNKSTIRAAIEIIVVQNNATPIQKFIFDPCTVSTNRTPGASPTSSGGSVVDDDLQITETFNYSVTVGPISNGSVMKIIPIYNSTKIGINSGSVVLPSQGKLVTSTGTSGETVRTVQYFESLPEIPTEILQYAILSQ